VPQFHVFESRRWNIRRCRGILGSRLRALSWLSNYRRLSTHYEYWTETGEAMIHLAMINLMPGRLTKAHADMSLT
jgi:transposase